MKTVQVLAQCCYFLRQAFDMSWILLFVLLLLQYVDGLVNAHVRVNSLDGKKTCTVIANGNRKDDVPNILVAFDECGHDGTIIFPENQTYWIAQRFNPVVKSLTIEWRGLWTVWIRLLVKVTPLIITPTV